MPLVSERKKQVDLVSLIEGAANNYVSGLTVETHHRLAAEYDQVSRNTVRSVMGDPYLYAEVLPSGSPTNASLTSGTASSVAHAFDVWMVYEYDEASSYSGSTQETFDNVTEGLDEQTPQGILPVVRDASTRTVDGLPITYQEPVDVDKNIIPLVQSGGSYDRVHRLQFEITIIEPS